MNHDFNFISNYSKESTLCQYIMYEPDWKAKLADFGLIIRYMDGEEKTDICQFESTDRCDKTNPITKEANGIIIYVDSYPHVLCWPQNNAYPYEDPCSDHIYWQPDQIEVYTWAGSTKVNLFFNEVKKAWQWSSRSVIDVKDDPQLWAHITESVNYPVIDSMINTGALNSWETYTFELVEPLPHNDNTYYELCFSSIRMIHGGYEFTPGSGSPDFGSSLIKNKLDSEELVISTATTTYDHIWKEKPDNEWQFEVVDYSGDNRDNHLNRVYI